MGGPLAFTSALISPSNETSAQSPEDKVCPGVTHVGHRWAGGRINWRQGARWATEGKAGVCGYQARRVRKLGPGLECREEVLCCLPTSFIHSFKKTLLSLPEAGLTNLFHKGFSAAQP